jgi:alpha-ribazole phosphatase
MTEILLIRHGQTDFNKAGKFGGITDVSLNETGIAQAASLARALANEKIEFLYSSDLRRCAQTCEDIQPVNEKIFLSGLREMSFGLWEGMTYDEIREKYPDALKAWENNWDNAAHQGESFREMSDRVLGIFDSIINEHKGADKKIAIVTHGGCICAILGMKIAGSLDNAWKFNVSNALVSRLFVSDGLISLKSLNERTS